MSNTEIENLKDPQEYQYRARFRKLSDFEEWAAQIPPSALRDSLAQYLKDTWDVDLPEWRGAPNDALHTLVENWQANGNSRALGDPKSEVWHRCASELMQALEAEKL